MGCEVALYQPILGIHLMEEKTWPGAPAQQVFLFASFELDKSGARSFARGPFQQKE